MNPRSLSVLWWFLISTTSVTTAFVPARLEYNGLERTKATTTSTITTAPKSFQSFHKGISSTTRWMSGDSLNGEKADTSSATPPLKVAVTGATGRTGSLVVNELLSRGVSVVAMVRSLDKGKEVFDVDQTKMNMIQVDLTSQNQIEKALVGCDAVIWCATGFSDPPEPNWFETVKGLFGITVPPKPKQSIDAVGLPLIANAMLTMMTNEEDSKKTTMKNLPKVIMLSSAGVTRPSWTDTKKTKLEGCADIPIVRLNPFDILNIKAASEQSLRESGVPYCIVRPTGLNDQWPSGSRPILSQGDVAVGRIHRQDVATVLCDVLNTPHACQKTFEVLTLAGYPPARTSSSSGSGIELALQRLVSDDIGPLSEQEVEANFNVLQQLLPGEVQNAAMLAMGQTYEQLDNGTTGRFGERGQENAEAAMASQPATANVV